MISNIFSKQSFDEPRLHETPGYELAYFTTACPTTDEINEDSIAFFDISESRIVLAVADGAGGYPTGEEASHCLVSMVGEKLESVDKKSLEGFRNPILDGIEAANASLMELGTGAKTTATVCEIVDGRFRSYQVGDSGALVCGQKGKEKFRTVFHSPVGYGVEAGLIGEEEALSEPDLNMVANIVGDRDMAIEIGPVVNLDERDSILVASDGVFDNFTGTDLAEMIRTGSILEAGEQIVGFFRERLASDPEAKRTKFDDLSFFIFRLRGR